MRREAELAPLEPVRSGTSRNRAKTCGGRPVQEREHAGFHGPASATVYAMKGRTKRGSGYKH